MWSGQEVHGHSRENVKVAKESEAKAKTLVKGKKAEQKSKARNAHFFYALTKSWASWTYYDALTMMVLW